MKKKGIFIVCFLMVIMLVGCSWLREGAVDLSEEHIKNMETARIIANNLNTAWPTFSGMLDGYYGDDLEDYLPPRALDAKDTLDEIVIELTWPPEELIDHPLEPSHEFRLGYSLGLHARFSIASTEALIKEILDRLPADLLGQVWKAFL